MQPAEGPWEEKQIIGANHGELVRIEEPVRFRWREGNCIFIYRRMLHGKELHRIPRIVFPHGEHTTRPQATKNKTHRRDPLRQWYVVEDPIAKNQIELLLRKIFGGGR